MRDRPQSSFSAAVVRWQATHGRNDLPWQNTRDPYRVWLSEIMLQQTQVSTVLGYFERFLRRFPDVSALAAAPRDDVLALWSGLGYYSRARNLHLCAQEVMGRCGGAFPQSASELQTLPGIGRSTAGAIASLCFGERVAILDGNVKRVLSRVLGFGADLSLAANERALWDQAAALLPRSDLRRRMPRYAQGMMDLGATVCSARNPACERCPVVRHCVAHEQGRVEHYPVKTRKLKRSAQTVWLLWAQTADAQVWLCERPTPGVWPGLRCFPAFDDRDTLAAAVPKRYRGALHDLAAVTHTLTHKDLTLQPVCVRLPKSALAGAAGAWFSAERWPQLALPTPIRRLLLSASAARGGA